MAPESSATTGLTRLADQVQDLSMLTETLTYRLLELEEKVADLDRTLQPMIQPAQGHGNGTCQLDADTEHRLDQTESRLAQLEVLLSGLESGSTDAAPEPEQPFLDDDGEQPFLDDELFAEQAPASITLVDGCDSHHSDDDAGYDERLSA